MAEALTDLKSGGIHVQENGVGRIGEPLIVLGSDPRRLLKGLRNRGRGRSQIGPSELSQDLLKGVGPIFPTAHGETTLFLDNGDDVGPPFADQFVGRKVLASDEGVLFRIYQILKGLVGVDQSLE